MAEKAAHEHHTIDYIEFTVAGMAAAKAFYGAAFGWEFNDYGPDYAGIRRGDGEAGGLRQDASVQRGGPLVVLFSEDLDATAAKVREAVPESQRNGNTDIATTGTMVGFAVMRTLDVARR